MSHVHGPGCNHGSGGNGQVQTINISDANLAPPLYKGIANFLRDEKKSGMKQKQGVFNGKRVDYFKGFAKTLPKDQKQPTERTDAVAILNELGRLGFILCVERGDPINGKHTPRVLRPCSVQEMNESGYYLWVWEGSQLRVYLGAIGMVGAILTAVLFPLWPDILKRGVWYLSVGTLGLLGVFFGIAIVRLILFIITMIILPRGFWLFPNLFEDVGVIDSFKPLYGWDEPKKKKNSSSSKAASSSSSSSSKTGSTTTTVEDVKED
ncbi:translocation protein Sec62-domain-containing protein [Halteromyces radiatus]|uniref:translocation protein Sec62-domain-containing protein n=1 Tax=Halteromyces radiatus TaxID=101107 RepID=UPI0022204DB1|nr:translocation protein Sec62-domain-containing protein [Halteromyces radiatus]KAI8098793.1 translocation protein Sec62-domain-containing protein [Halteromyces radiatus]